MLVHLLNAVLKARNDSSIVALRSTPLFSFLVGYRMLTYNVVDAWSIRRPNGVLAGDYPNLLTAFAAAWRIEP
jgi:hypothetical protein